MASIKVAGRTDEIDAEIGERLLAALKQAAVPISTSCGGQGICGLCRLKVVRGAPLLTPVTAKEVAHIGNVAKVVNIRLACQTLVRESGDVEVDVPPVLDIVARKREQTRRGMAERASRRSSTPGSASQSDRGKRPSYEKIEWRPRKIAQLERASAEALVAEATDSAKGEVLHASSKPARPPPGPAGTVPPVSRSGGGSGRG